MKYDAKRWQSAAMEGTLHLVRHGEVENPKGVIYGRMPGYHLSERGRRQAGAASDRLRQRDIVAVVASPLERAQETAATIAEPHGLEVGTDERFIESETFLEDLGRSVRYFIRSPRAWWHFRNPLRPSWGESFLEIRRRVLEGIRELMDAHEGREVVVVSHQTPVQVARLALARRNVPPWIGLAPCSTGSVTSIDLKTDRVVSIAYYAPPT
ncbi:MAG: histidine phosphatase family protein [Actinomycetota bacterium]